MSKTVTIRGLPYEIPEQGEDPLWGEYTTAFFEALVDALALINGPGDISETTFTIVDGGSGDVTNLLFNGNTVGSAIIQYNVLQDTVATTMEAGIIIAVFDDVANTWSFSKEATGDAKVTFGVTTVSSIGQFTYSALTIGDNRTMKFKAQTLGK